MCISADFEDCPEVYHTVLIANPDVDIEGTQVLEVFVDKKATITKITLCWLGSVNNKER